jgi:hypothetical protein
MYMSLWAVTTTARELLEPAGQVSAWTDSVAECVWLLFEQFADHHHGDKQQATENNG